MKPYKIYIPDPAGVVKTEQVKEVNYVGPIEGMLYTLFKGGVVFITFLLGCCWLMARLNGGI